MIRGIGVDITSLNRITKVYNRFPRRFPSRILQRNELKDFNGCCKFLAVRWAIREAMFKATQSFNVSLIRMGEQTISLDPKIKLSVSHEQDLVCAFVVVE